MNEPNKIKRLNDEIDKYLDRLQESHKEVAELKTLIYRYINHVEECEGYNFIDCSSLEDQIKVNEIYKVNYENN